MDLGARDADPKSASDLRREWDSNPRRLAPHGFSRAAHLSALPSLRAGQGSRRAVARKRGATGLPARSVPSTSSSMRRRSVRAPPTTRRPPRRDSSASARMAGPAAPDAGYDPRNLTPASSAWRSREAVGHHRVGHVAFEVDDEAVVAERLLGRSGLQLRQVDVPCREVAEDGVQAAGMVALWKQAMVVRSWPVGVGMPCVATAMNRVWLSGWSSTRSDRISRP